MFQMFLFFIDLKLSPFTTVFFKSCFLTRMVYDNFETVSSNFILYEIQYIIESLINR